MKALALFSGGLDSLLAIKIIKDMGIEVLALHFDIGFIGKNDKSEALRAILDQIEVPLKVVDIKRQFFNEVFEKNIPLTLQDHENEDNHRGGTHLCGRKI